jgi:ABC-2 type transport system permease protein
MHKMTLRNVWLISKREYLERVRTKAFLIFTLLTPALAIAWAVIPGLMFNAKSGGTRNLVVVTSNAQFGEAIKDRLSNPPASAEEPDSRRKSRQEALQDIRYNVTISNDVSEQERSALQKKIDTKEIDSFIWLDSKALEEHALTYTAASVSDFSELNGLRSAVRDALMKQDLRTRGLSDSDVENVLKTYKIDTVQWKDGKIKKSNEGLQFIGIFILGFAMYMTVLIFGMSVMRSVLQEKTSRIMEVMMSCVASTDLMAGKILGVGAVGLTQIVIWVLMGAVASTPGFTMMADVVKQANYSVSTGIYFATFFLLGYFLYSALCAALGAMVNSEQEAQQIQMFVMMPLILSFFMMFLAIRVPNDPRVVIVSMIPFAAPLVMFARIVVQTPPFWQIATCIGIMLATIYLVLQITSRIYRVGILMYGKRPTLPEIIKWIRYA